MIRSKNIWLAVVVAVVFAIGMLLPLWGGAANAAPQRNNPRFERRSYGAWFETGYAEWTAPLEWNQYGFEVTMLRYIREGNNETGQGVIWYQNINYLLDWNNVAQIATGHGGNPGGGRVNVHWGRNQMMISYGRRVDSQLIRRVDVATNLWRVDLLGLSNNVLEFQQAMGNVPDLDNVLRRVGNTGALFPENVDTDPDNNTYVELNDEDNVVSPIRYMLRVRPIQFPGVPDNAELWYGIEPYAFDRQGYAFSYNSIAGGHDFSLIPAWDRPDGEGEGGWDRTHTTGAYNLDGSLREDAVVHYVKHSNRDVVFSVDNFFGSNNTQNTAPIAIRVLGQVGDVGTHRNDPSGRPELAAGGNLPLQRLHGVTIEGVGNNASIIGFGFAINQSTNVVVRNLRFDNWVDDAIFINGGNAIANQAHQTSSHLWVVHNTFGYGQDQWNTGSGDPDHIRADGGVDINNGTTHFTVAYNSFEGSGKTMLVGGAATARIGHGTLHHNSINSTDERTPRLRNGWMHVFNNVYTGVGGEPFTGGGYGIGAGHRANIISEGNTFLNTFRPYIVSGSRSGNAAGPNPDGNVNTLSNDAPGIIVTSRLPALANGAQRLAILGNARQLVPDSLDTFSSDPRWFFEDELVFGDIPVTGTENGYFMLNVAALGGAMPTAVNNMRMSEIRLGHTFVPFGSEFAFPGTITNWDLNNNNAAWNNDGLTFGNTSGTNVPVGFERRAHIHETLSDIGVQSAAAAAYRVDAMAGAQYRSDTERLPDIQLLTHMPVIGIGQSTQILVSVPHGATLPSGIVWSSSNTSVATVGPHGHVSGVSPGTVTVTASLGVVHLGTIIVTVTPWVFSPQILGDVSMTAGTLQGLRVKNIQSGVLFPPTSLTWSTSNNAVASVDNNGNVTAHTAGTVVITATLYVNFDTITIVVSPRVTAITVTGERYMNIGDEQTLTATLAPTGVTSHVLWTSSDSSIAMVSGDGVVVARNAGTVVVSIVEQDGTEGSMTIVVRPNESGDGSGGGCGSSNAIGFASIGALLVAGALFRRFRQ